MSKKYYLTTPLYYVNSRPHIGHSYTEIAADTLARFYRLTGRRVFFLTGTDEHGQKVAKAAETAGMHPQEFTDKISLTFRDLWKTLNISEHEFIRTTEPRHQKAVQAVWRELERRKEIYQGVYSGWYCTPDETFWTEAQVLTEGGQTLCPDCKRAVEKIEEENYFLRLSAHQPWLIEEVKSGARMKVLPETRKNEVLGFLENNALQDLCISRPKSRLSWGIPSPLSEAHVTYVWFDALINYITACGYGTDKGIDARWPADVHLIGKDILRHHAVIWPILLHAVGLEPPKMIFAHGWWVQGGEKMSKSRGNVVDPVEIVDQYGVDAYRYFLLREAPFGEDGVFSEEALIKRFNTDLANDLGNLVSRTLTMCEKYFDGDIPVVLWPKKPSESTMNSKIIQGYLYLRTRVDQLGVDLKDPMEALAFHEALRQIWELINRANKYIEETEPWNLLKNSQVDELRFVIGTLLEVLKAISQVIQPFMPFTGESIWKQLGLQTIPSKSSFEEDAWGSFKNGGKILKSPPLFPRIVQKGST